MEPKTQQQIDLDNALASQIWEMALTGKEVIVDPEVADMMGAFEETAMSLDDALDARFD